MLWTDNYIPVADDTDFPRKLGSGYECTFHNPMWRVQLALMCQCAIHYYGLSSIEYRIIVVVHAQRGTKPSDMASSVYPAPVVGGPGQSSEVP